MIDSLEPSTGDNRTRVDHTLVSRGKPQSQSADMLDSLLFQQLLAQAPISPLNLTTDHNGFSHLLTHQSLPMASTQQLASIQQLQQQLQPLIIQQLNQPQRAKLKVELSLAKLGNIQVSIQGSHIELKSNNKQTADKINQAKDLLAQGLTQHSGAYVSIEVKS